MTRLEAAELTPEDQLVWLRVIITSGLPANVLFATYGFMCDRRDADLMLAFADLCGQGWASDTRHTMWATIGLPYSDIEAMLIWRLVPAE